MSRSRVRAIVWEAVERLNERLEHTIALAQGEDALLFGGDGPLDSFSLICLITDIEDKLERKLAVTVVLANDAALVRGVPFVTLGSLIAHAQSLVKR